MCSATAASTARRSGGRSAAALLPRRQTALSAITRRLPSRASRICARGIRRVLRDVLDRADHELRFAVGAAPREGRDEQDHQQTRKQHPHRAAT